VRQILVEAHQQVTALLAEHRDELDGLAHALLEHETLDGPAAYRAAMRPHPRGPEPVLPLDSVRRDA
jgi:cell division protease FtsH